MFLPFNKTRPEQRYLTPEKRSNNKEEKQNV